MDPTHLDRLPPAYRRAAQTILAEYSARPDVLAVLLTGSVTRGQAGPMSDLDVWVLTEAPARIRSSLVVDGVPVEVFYNSPAWTARYLAQGDVSAMNMVGYGWPAYIRPDAAAPVAELQARARAAYEQGPPAPTADETGRRRNLAIDTLLDAQDVLESDPLAATLVLNNALEQVLRWYYAERRAWMPKLKRLPADLATRDQALAGAVRSYLVAADAPARHAALLGVFALVYPAGHGLDQWCWESTPEPFSE
ncbi:MAG TPA: nucleotidyltransferase domain-containing protein [Chloroflexia bacterium]